MTLAEVALDLRKKLKARIWCFTLTWANNSKTFPSLGRAGGRDKLAANIEYVSKEQLGLCDSCTGCGITSQNYIQLLMTLETNLILLWLLCFKTNQPLTLVNKQTNKLWPLNKKREHNLESTFHTNVQHRGLQLLYST